MRHNSNIGTLFSLAEVDIDDLVFTKINAVLDRQDDNPWTCTMTSLRSAINRIASRHQRSVLPGSPSALRVTVNRIANRLRNRGVGVRFGRITDHARTRYVRFTR